MLAYVELIQRKEKEIGCDVLTHQKWSGASYIDRVLAGRSSDTSLARLELTTSCHRSRLGRIVRHRCLGQGVDRGIVPLEVYIEIPHVLKGQD